MKCVEGADYYEFCRVCYKVAISRYISSAYFCLYHALAQSLYTPFTGIKKHKTFSQQKVAEKSEKQLKGEQQLRQQAGIK